MLHSAPQLLLHIVVKKWTLQQAQTETHWGSNPSAPYAYSMNALFVSEVGAADRRVNAITPSMFVSDCENDDKNYTCCFKPSCIYL